MKKNILIALGILLAVIIIALVGCGLYLIKINTPKGCVSLQNYNYPPAFAIMEDTAYDFSSPEIAKIVNVKDSCVAVITGQDSSTDKCEAVTNLSEALYLLAHNAKNTNNASDKQTVLNYLTETQKSIGTPDKTSCKEGYELFDKAVSDITKAFSTTTK